MEKHELMDKIIQHQMRKITTAQMAEFLDEYTDSIQKDPAYLLRSTVERISIHSILTETQALDVINSAMIHPQWLDFFAPIIIELANKREIIEVIKLECKSLASQISIAGSLECYKMIKHID